MRRAKIQHGAEPSGAGWAPVVELDGRRLLIDRAAYDRDYAEELARKRAMDLAEALARKDVVIVEPLNLDGGLRVSGHLLEQLRLEVARIARLLTKARNEHVLPPEVALAGGYAAHLAMRLGTPAAEIAPDAREVEAPRG